MKNNKAITLIALIITIIVLLILAGVTINMVLGENGLINKSKTSVAKYENAQEKENTALKDYETEIDNASRDTVTISKEDYDKLMKKGTWELLTSYSGTTEVEKDVKNLSQFTSICIVVRDDDYIMSSDFYSYEMFKNALVNYSMYFNTNTRLAKVWYVTDEKIKTKCETNSENIKMSLEVYGIY